MSITDYIVSKTDRLHTEPEISPNGVGFHMFNDAGTEVEVSEFLYGFVRMIQPTSVLETGTHRGVSATYIGQALKDNGKGHLTTLEFEDIHITEAIKLFEDVNVLEYITPLRRDIREYTTEEKFDFIFLDSEPNLRFDEFVKFWPNVIPGGFIAIHDLNEQLSHSGITVEGMYDWPYGDFREKIGDYILNNDVQTMTFPTPRGLTLFQKYRSDFAFTNFIRGTLSD